MIWMICELKRIVLCVVRTCVAIAGADYCVIAADTRVSSGFSILTRDGTKILDLTPSCVLASAGFQGDRTTLHRMLQAKHVQCITCLDY